MPIVNKSPLPAHANIRQRIQPGDFLDGYSCASDLSAKDAATRAMTLPGWAAKLLQLRNALVVPLGLKNTSDNTDKTAGDSPVQFPVTFETETELQFGYDDRHLDFRITVLQHDGQIFMSTWVHPHNLLGQTYLALVMPFHIAIVRNAVGRVAQGE